MKEVGEQALDLNTCRILITATTFGKTDPGLKSALESAVGEVIYNPMGRPLSSAELSPLLLEMDGCIAGLDRFDASAIEAARRLKVIARYGAGVDAVDLAAATRKGIVVTNTPGANAVAVAELTIGLMLAIARRICSADQATRRGEWPRYAGVSLQGKDVGLVGFGAIGRAVALRLAGFGCTILASDPFVSPETAKEWGASMVSLEELLASSDFVSLHAALNPATRGMVGERFLGMMKPGAFLVNTARGELIDETALLCALKAGNLRGAALDCFSKEPPNADHPLFRLPQVILTPHMGAHTDEAASAMGWMSLRDCLAVLRGEKPEHIVNPEVYGGY